MYNNSHKAFDEARKFIPGGVNKNPFKLGRLAKERTKYSGIKNYPV